jgi:SAM-dependent methyltransferase
LENIINNDFAMQLPQSFNWKFWVTRWERMQERYLVKRNKRFDIIIQLIKETQTDLTSIVDLGCGPGSLTIRLLEAFPDIQIIGIDVDPTLLPLAQLRTARFGEQIRFIQKDLRDPAWTNFLSEQVDTVVSATALHWLNKKQLKQVYKQIASVLFHGGIFLNADHVRNDFLPLQKFWEWHREEMRKQQRDPRADDWNTFINTYLDELGPAAREIRQQALGAWEGSEEGFPLAWHFDQLRNSGFEHIECFWRCDCDAIYGGFCRKS